MKGAYYLLLYCIILRIKNNNYPSFAKIIITAHKERALAAVNLQNALRRPEPFKALKVK